MRSAKCGPSFQLSASASDGSIETHPLCVLAVLMIGLVIVVLIYIACLFLTLEERTSAPYVATFSIY
jgi:hypothetical protein